MKSLLTLFTLAFAVILNAQPVLTSSNIPAVGSVLNYGYISVPPAFQIIPGASQTWSFSDGNPEGTFSMEFLSTSSVPAAALVPGCNFVLKYIYDGSPEFEYAFSSLSEDEWLTLGSTTDINEVEYLYDSPETYFKLPVTMGSSYLITDSYSYTYYMGSPEADSAKIVSTDSIYHSVDAFGVISINGISYQVLLQKIESVQTNSNYTFLNGIWTYEGSNGSTDVSYQFIAPSVGGAVLAFSIETDDLGVETWHVYYLQSSTITSIENNAKMDAFKLYPNPANSLLNISFPNQENQVINIADVSGKLVKSINSNNQFSTSVDIRDLAKGMYFVNVSNSQGKIAETKKLIVQ